MNSVFIKGLILLFVALWFSNANAAEPYIQLETGILARDVIVENPDLVDFKFRTEADSTRLIAKIGVKLWEILDLYLMGGGADLSLGGGGTITNYDAQIEGAYGGGIRLNLYRSPYRDRLTLFVEGNALRFTTDDRVNFEQKCEPESGCTIAPNEFIERIGDEEIQWNEYTVMIGGSSQFVGFTPYGGIRLSRVDAKDRIHALRDDNFSLDFRTRSDLEEDDNFGIFFGVDIFLDRSEKTSLNFEVSMIDQDSFRAAIRREF